MKYFLNFTVLFSAVFFLSACGLISNEAAYNATVINASSSRIDQCRFIAEKGLPVISALPSGTIATIIIDDGKTPDGRNFQWTAQGKTWQGNTGLVLSTFYLTLYDNGVYMVSDRKYLQAAHNAIQMAP